MLDGTSGDMSDDLYSEINTCDTEQLLKPRIGSKPRRTTASTCKSLFNPVQIAE